MATPKKNVKKTTVKTSLKKKVSPKKVSVSQDLKKEPIVKTTTRQVETKVDQQDENVGTFSWWALLSTILILVFVTILVYQNNVTFRQNVNKFVASTGLVSENNNTSNTVNNAPVFNMKMNIVYNKDDAYMEKTIKDYLVNIENNLGNTKVDANWVDKNSDEGKAIIEALNAKFLPIFTTDSSITKHPKYTQFAPAINVVGDIYHFQSEGMEYLVTPEVNDANHMGANPETAKVKIIEYMSLTCSYCKTMQPILEKAMDKYGKDVVWVVKHYDRGGIDSLLAQGAECAAEQNKFEEMMSDVFARQSEIGSAITSEETMKKDVIEQLKISAKNVKINTDKLASCVESGKYAQKVEDQTKEGLEFGIMGTPGFFINNRFIGGATDEETFMKIIEEQLN